MLQAASAALGQITTPPFRGTLWKVLAITLVLLGGLWFGLDKFIIGYIAAPWPWLASALSILTGVGLFIGMAFLVAPASSLVASLFLDDLADIVERDIYPAGVRGAPISAGQSLWLGLRFALVSLGVNLVALALFLIPGVNALVFLVANAYLLGREYFELAALRFRPIEEVRQLRERHAVTLFLCGLCIAVFVAIPIVNLLTPLFGVAFMVRMHKKLSFDAAAKTPLRDEAQWRPFR
jgi:CysZ protein